MPSTRTRTTYVERNGTTFAVAPLTGVALGGKDDEIRFTTRVVSNLAPDRRAAAARNFIGFYCRLVIGDRAGWRLEYPEVAVEGVASSTLSGQSHMLVITRGSSVHDLSDMEVISLATIRSIETIRRF